MPGENAMSRRRKREREGGPSRPRRAVPGRVRGGDTRGFAVGDLPKNESPLPASARKSESSKETWVPADQRRCADCFHYHALLRQPIEGLCSAEPPEFVGQPIAGGRERELTEDDFEFPVVDLMRTGCGKWSPRTSSPIRRCADCGLFCRLNTQPESGACYGSPPRFIGGEYEKRELNQVCFTQPILNDRAHCGEWRAKRE